MPRPSENIVHDTVYDVLRPGAIISSRLENNDSPVIASTTTGVLVADKDGNSYITAATHRIGDTGIVRTPNSDKIIGMASKDIPRTDICLVELNDDVEFENKPFVTTKGAPLELTRLANADDDFTQDTCFLDSSFTGLMIGSVVAKSLKVEEFGGVSHIGYDWTYTGQEEGNDGKVHPPNITKFTPYGRFRTSSTAEF